MVYRHAMLSRSCWQAPTLVAMVALFAPGAGAGQNPTPTKIVGCVMDDWFSAWPGIEIALAGADGRRTVTTSVDGCYELTGVARGVYALSAQDRLLVPQTREVKVEGQPTLIFDFVLKDRPGVVREPPLFITGRPNADTDPQIHGCVTDRSGMPLPGAVLTGLPRDAVTDQDGCFRVAVPPGGYRLRARVNGSESPEVGPIVVAMGDRRRCPVIVLDRREP
jgi:hypothetical protein